MYTTSKGMTGAKPSTIASGTTARLGQWCLPMEWYATNLYLVGLVIADDVLQAPGQPLNGFDLPQEKNYGNG